VCDEFWLVADGRVDAFDGDLDDYQRWLLDRAREEQKAAQKAQRETLRPISRRQRSRASA
jgi:ATP-binding cassette subfamily F protein 3